ncbi:MAG TPA: MBL fold metallo-hydrolase [Clostridia bacterium]|nr:MBL fold metallo-hydrolase [Clostridia bacterium]
MLETFLFKGFLEYEIVYKPFFGSKKRAYNTLRNLTTPPSSTEEFLEYIQLNHPKIMPNIEFVRFYDFNFMEKTGLFRYRLAILHTVPNALIREKIFDESENIANLTGWYPYVTGSRAQIKKLNYIELRKKHNIQRMAINSCAFGKPKIVIDVSNSPTASATLLQCEYGNILFDTGFGIFETYIKDIDLICISHFHKDHIGGLTQILAQKSIAVLISEMTLEYILNSNWLSDGDKLEIIKHAITLEEIKFYKGLRMHIDYFPVFHAPGSFGFVYKYFSETSVFYLGDLCIENGFYNGGIDVNAKVQSIRSKNKTIILDSSMIGKKNIEIGEDTPEDIQEIIENSINKRNVFFVSQSPETLLYSYILAFIWSNQRKEEKIRIVMDDDLYKIIKILWRPQVLKDNFKDPFIKYVLKGCRINFAESHRLYPLSALDTFSDTKNTIFLVTLEDIIDKDTTRLPLLKSDVMLVGPWALKGEIPEEVINAKPRSILRVASPDWSFHSSEQSLNSAITEWNEEAIHVILFHNYSSALKKYIKQFPNYSNIHAISKDGVAITS